MGGVEDEDVLTPVVAMKVYPGGWGAFVGMKIWYVTFVVAGSLKTVRVLWGKEENLIHACLSFGLGVTKRDCVPFPPSVFEN